jgi:TonB-linked SusC/RagA family outer membrane protein
MTRLASFVLVGAALALAAVPVSAAAQATAQRQQSVRFLLASNGAPPVALDVGRTPVLRQRLTLDLQGVTVREALTAISDRARLVLWYTDDVIAADRRVNLRADEITVAAALTDVLVDAGVDVVLNQDGTAVIVKRLASVALVQVGTVAGRVTDSTSREGVGGVTITVEGTRLSTTTAADGGYAIRGVPAGNRSIIARRLGFVRQSQTVSVTDNESATVDFVLANAPTTLSEVVTTATGDQRRVELGHVVGRINADSIVKASPVSSISELLNGRVSGLQVSTHQGTVGGDVSLQIRGPNTIQLSNEPIIVVDGIRFMSRPADRLSLSNVNAVEMTSPLNDLNPNEIESIEVVKGPSAATLYGTDAANGVIVITTKRGRPGPARWNAYVRSTVMAIPTIDYADAYWGWQSVGGVPATESFRNCYLVLVGMRRCTQDSVAIIKNPFNNAELTIFESKPRWQYGVNVSGGSDRLRYFVAGGFEQATGPLRMPPGTVDSISLERPVPPEQIHPNALAMLNLRTNVGVRVGNTGDVQVNAGYSGRSTRTLGSGFANPYASGLTQPVVNQPFGRFGPAEFFSRTTTESVDRVFASTRVTLPLAPWLQTRITGGLDLSNVRRTSLAPRGQAPGILSGAFERGAVGDDRGRQLVTTAEVIGAASFAWGRIASRTSVGAQYVRSVDDMLGSLGTDLPPGATTVGAAVTVRSRQQYRELITLGSYAEQMVALNQRIFVTGAIRADGASTFGRNYDAAVYPKASVSWLVSEEPLIPRVLGLGELRLRYAFGASGQQPRPEWARPGYAVEQALVQGTVGNVYAVNTLGNPDLRPERVREHEFGIDGSILERRLEVGFTWYRRETIDQIVSVDLPPGFGTIQTNLGLTAGRGFEADLSARLVETRGSSWLASVRHSFQRTTLKNLGGAVERRSIFGGWVEGYPIGARFARPLLGYEDLNADGVLNPFTGELQFGDSLEFVGESRPPRTTSINTTVSIMGGRVRLSAMLERRSGFTQLDALRRSQCTNTLCRGAVDPSAPLEEIAVAAAVRRQSDVDAFIEPGDYSRLREVGITVDISEAMRRIRAGKSATLSVQGRNLALWTAYSGADPESASLGSIAQEIGIPQARTWVVRFDLGF